MSSTSYTQQFIPKIWAEAIEQSLRTRLSDPFGEHAREEHERRMREDPDYAKAYEIRKAADMTEDYWTALFENWFPTEDEDEYW